MYWSNDVPVTKAAATVAFLAAIPLCVMVVVSSPGCMPAETPFLAKPAARPEPVYCFDAVGHKAGSKPFILGGTCCCTPSAAVLSDYKSCGHVSQDMTLQDLLRLYQDAGIRTALDHRHCNNLCGWGPHVVKGGKCMVCPTPGTSNFEEVRFGLKYVPVEAGKQQAKK